MTHINYYVGRSLPNVRGYPTAGFARPYTAYPSLVGEQDAVVITEDEVRAELGRGWEPDAAPILRPPWLPVAALATLGAVADASLDRMRQAAANF